MIDEGGKFLVPGLWDMHVHTDGEDRPLGLFRAYGITGIRDMGGDVAKLSNARHRMNSGELVGPRVVFSGPILKGPPSQLDSGTWIVRSPDEARRAVKKLLALHVDFIKVHDGIARDSYLAIAATCKQNHIPFVGHVPASITPDEASDLGQKSIEHLEFILKPCLFLFNSAGVNSHALPPACKLKSLDASLHRFALNGTWLDPTIQSFRFFAPAQWEGIFAEFRKLVQAIRRDRVSILAGTDWSDSLEEKGDAPGASLHDELSLLVDSGFTPAEALRAATLNPAIFLGLSDSLGTIDTGKAADLVLLNANPLQGIGNTRSTFAVISKGRYFDRQELTRAIHESCPKCPEDGAQP
jgi:imidazolonepropionase-like amidohydrolase